MIGGSVFVVLQPQPTQATADLRTDILKETKRSARGTFETNLGTDNPENYFLGIIGRATNYLFGILGVIAVILIIYSGFLWMTAGGNDQQITKAKTIIKRVAIGIIIATVAYSIVAFVITAVTSATRQESTPAPASTSPVGGGGPVTVPF